MIYPAWFPSAQLLAVMNNQSSASPRPNTTVIEPNGTPQAKALAGSDLWAGMPSVNPVNSNLIIFAGQNVENGGAYNQDQNYIWLADTSQNPVNPVPLGAPHSGNFEPQWQGRAPWWSPDWQWVAFESYRASPPSSEHKMNHAKWYPNGFLGGPSGNQTLIVASYQPGTSGKPTWPYGIANLDVSPIVG